MHSLLQQNRNLRSHHRPDNDLLDGGLGKVEAGYVIPRDSSAVVHDLATVNTGIVHTVCVHCVDTSTSFMMSSTIRGSMFLSLSSPSSSGGS